jgi:hypothetical protein
VAIVLATSRRRWSHCRRLLILCGAVAAYFWLYDQCVRMPFVALKINCKPYYALGRHPRPGIDQASMGVGEFRLPGGPLWTWFFWPAHQLDKQLHPGRWDDLPREALP